jgi:hypothetical protein
MVISGCGRSQPEPPASAADDRDSPNIAPEGRVIDEAPPGEPESNLPVMTAHSPPIILTPIQGDATTEPAQNSPSTETWKTFTSSNLGVALDYPPDWTVMEGSEEVTFTAPNGGTIQLKAGAASLNNNELKTGNRRCTSRTNQHDLSAEVCVSTASFFYTATFDLQKAGGSTQRVILMTQTRTVADAFEAIFNSVRLVG